MGILSQLKYVLRQLFSHHHNVLLNWQLRFCLQPKLLYFFLLYLPKELYFIVAPLQILWFFECQVFRSYDDMPGPSTDVVQHIALLCQEASQSSRNWGVKHKIYPKFQATFDLPCDKYLINYLIKFKWDTAWWRHHPLEINSLN